MRIHVRIAEAPRWVRRTLKRWAKQEVPAPSQDSVSTHQMRIYDLNLDEPPVRLRLFDHYCFRCENVWMSKLQFPKRCSRCRTPLWNTPRQQPQTETAA